MQGQLDNRPVNYVSWGDAARFCNWLQTGNTETGAYTLNGATTNSALMAVTRNANAQYFIPRISTSPIVVGLLRSEQVWCWPSRLLVVSDQT